MGFRYKGYGWDYNVLNSSFDAFVLNLPKQNCKCTVRNPPFTKQLWDEIHGNRVMLTLWFLVFVFELYRSKKKTNKLLYLVSLFAGSNQQRKFRKGFFNCLNWNDHLHYKCIIKMSLC